MPGGRRWWRIARWWPVVVALVATIALAVSGQCLFANSGRSGSVGGRAASIGDRAPSDAQAVAAAASAAFVGTALASDGTLSAHGPRPTSGERARPVRRHRLSAVPHKPMSPTTPKTPPAATAETAITRVVRRTALRKTRSKAPTRSIAKVRSSREPIRSTEHDYPAYRRI